MRSLSGVGVVDIDRDVVDADDAAWRCRTGR